MPPVADAHQAVRWNLTALFSGIDDPKIGQVWAALDTHADNFAARYRGKVSTLSASDLQAAMTEYEEIAREAAKPTIYANLVFAADTAAEHGAFLQSQTEKASALSVKLMFFDLEIQTAPTEVADRWLADANLDPYRHYVGVARKDAPHRLSEAEEIILEETSNTGSRAWQRFFDEVLSSHEFHYTDPGTGASEVLSEQMVLSKLRDADRSVRLAAAESFTAGLKSLERVLVFTFNTLLQDKSMEDRLRRRPTPEHSRHSANELDAETVQLVADLCREQGDIVARYYRVKRAILGLPELTHIDRYAPLFEAEGKVTWDEARSMVLEAFGEFSTTIRDHAKEFFDHGWIDAEVRQGKTGGAFCSGITPDLHPVILMSYQEKMDDVGTLAHELGHGVHDRLAKKQTYFNYHPTLPMAELASTFAEMLVFEKLVAGASRRDKLALYAEKIEGTFATVFRQAALYRFEQRIHRVRREQGELTAEQFGDIWQDELQSMFGDAVKLGDQHRLWWMYISHFVQVPFYVYAYAFGELLAMSLYGKAKSEGPAFVDRYLALLGMGGSCSPAEQTASVGVDLNDRGFWMGGFAALEALVAEFERLWAEESAASASR